VSPSENIFAWPDLGARQNFPYGRILREDDRRFCLMRVDSSPSLGEALTAHTAIPGREPECTILMNQAIKSNELESSLKGECSSARNLSLRPEKISSRPFCTLVHLLLPLLGILQAGSCLVTATILVLVKTEDLPERESDLVIYKRVSWSVQGGFTHGFVVEFVSTEAIMSRKIRYIRPP
jgi:hypothetical protein